MSRWPTQVINATEYRKVPLSLLNPSRSNPRRTLRPDCQTYLGEKFAQYEVNPRYLSPMMPHTSSQNPESPPTGLRILHSPTDVNEKLDYSSIARQTSRYSGQKCLLISGACARTTDEKCTSIFELFNMFGAHGRSRLAAASSSFVARGTCKQRSHPNLSKEYYQN